MKLFEPASIGNITTKSRIIRSGTYEGCADENGFPTDDYKKMYVNLAANEVVAIITGFAYISKEGRAMQKFQAGIDSHEKINVYKSVTDEVHKYGSKIFLQLAHCGRQTRRTETGCNPRSVSKKKSLYFSGNPEILATEEIKKIIECFGKSAEYAMNAGFDGIQLHAAHGYLIHQFILPSINNRKDIYGIDSEYKIGIKFLSDIVNKIRDKCGKDFPVLIKISGSDDLFNSFNNEQLIQLTKFLNSINISAIEISYGTMDYAFSIIRGEIPEEVILNINPIYKTNNYFKRLFYKRIIFPLIKLKIKKFEEGYNTCYSSIVKKYSRIPVICVGGFRNKHNMEIAIAENKTDFISLCRPFIAESDFIIKLQTDDNYQSKCSNCNICAVMCDSNSVTKCYRNF